MNDNITEINKDTFWKLIQSAKETCGQDMDAMMDFLKDRLVSMGPEQAQNFHDILHAYPGFRSVSVRCAMPGPKSTTPAVSMFMWTPPTTTARV